MAHLNTDRPIRSAAAPGGLAATMAAVAVVAANRSAKGRPPVARDGSLGRGRRGEAEPSERDLPADREGTPSSDAFPTPRRLPTGLY